MKAPRHFSVILLLCFLCRISTSTAGEPAVIPDERDRQVLEAVLLDLLPDVAFRNARLPRTATNIVLHLRTPEKTGMIQPDQMRYDTGKEHTIPEDIAGALVRRNAKPGTYDSVFALFKDLKFDPRIIVDEVAGKNEGRSPAFEQKYPSARGWVEPYLPGYSKDGTRAVVRAWIGPSEHGAVATALLEKTGGKWLVKWHHLAFFL